MIARHTRAKRNDTGFVLVEALMSGFALVAFLTLVGVVGAQIALAVPSIFDARHEARLTTLRTSLENVVALQEIHYADHRRYAEDLSTLGATEADGVEITIDASASGWTATAAATGTTGGASCTISVPAPTAGRDPSPHHPICLD